MKLTAEESETGNSTEEPFDHVLTQQICYESAENSRGELCIFQYEVNEQCVYEMNKYDGSLSGSSCSTEKEQEANQEEEKSDIFEWSEEAPISYGAFEDICGIFETQIRYVKLPAREECNSHGEQSSIASIISESEDASSESAQVEKPLVEGKQFEEIAAKEDDCECCDVYLDRSDSAATDSEPGEQPLEEGAQMERICEGEQQNECVDYFLDMSEPEECIPEPPEAPLIEGRIFEQIANAEDDEKITELGSSGIIAEDQEQYEHDELAVDIQTADEAQQIAEIKANACEAELENKSETRIGLDSRVEFETAVDSESLPACKKYEPHLEPHIRFERFITKNETISEVSAEVESDIRKPRYRFASPALERYSAPINIDELSNMSPGRRRLFEILSSNEEEGRSRQAEMQRAATDRLVANRKPCLTTTFSEQKEDKRKISQPLPKISMREAKKYNYEYLQVGKLVRSIISQPAVFRGRTDAGVGDDEQL